MAKVKQDKAAKGKKKSATPKKAGADKSAKGAAPKKSGTARSAAAIRAEGFRQALAEFFVGQGEQDQMEEEAPDIHFGVAELHGREAIHQYLSFRLADELYAVSILFIKEIIKPSLFTELPRVAPVILGVISLRGTIVPVIDLRLMLGLDELAQTRRSRILIVSTGGDDQIGMLVDEVRSVIRLHEEDIEPPPAVFGRTEAEHIQGVGRFDGEMYTLLELDTIVQLENHVLVGKEGRAK